MNRIDPKPDGRNRRIAIVAARFNEEVVEMLLDGCLQTLRAQDVRDDHITLVRVPGAWELPLACAQLAETGRYDAVIALGAVIRGETAHFDFISAECARGLGEAALGTGVPIAFGVLTPENGEQARDRADPMRKNKGREVALAALEMAALGDDIVDLMDVDMNGDPVDAR
ncbi:6,7-dimethyl-8-ribityllumazine synthase [Wenzhouxiangella sp. XN79A]|uniref:6,7-dimethyl-8-ribityllumazine synthase n=1 Tax=Wenzhouxiangella sp. XN79A TaxID=2724193 RepID=UPI00144AD312|nr:6,7-dimethyl-8-ribityllumazine synthase [Wenzhouxiangella sp. XN79A]NKI36575.1 6,7-dimethyl-8-ribityllumazine synthase [Wenzhouxiangella sp. XN79A]